MMSICRLDMAPAAAILAGLVLAAVATAAEPAASQREDRGEMRCGLAVLLGADVQRAVALADRGLYVHAIDADAGRVRAARADLARRGLHADRIAIDACAAGRLPYADNTVNVLAAPDAPGGELRLGREEILRALVPGGVAELGDQRVTKPRPAAMGEWTHPRCGPEGNPVSPDSQVAPSRQIRWQAGPLWGHHCGPVGAVCSGGRLIYVLREQPLGVNVMPRYYLTARDAYNGLLLWRRTVPGQANKSWPMYTPQFPAAALVADDDRVYTVPAPGGPLTAIDSRTGKVLRTYDAAPSPQSVTLSEGVLVLGRPTELHAVDLTTGRPLWQQSSTLTAPRDIWTTSTVLAVDGKTIFRQQPKGKPTELVALHTKSGQPAWTADATGLPEGRWDGFVLLLGYQKTVLLRSVAAVCAVSLDDGKLLWHRPGKVNSAFGTGGRVWLEGKTSLNDTLYGWTAVDPTTGRPDREVGVPAKLPEGISGKRILDGQCNFPVATANYIVTTTRMSLVDLRTGGFHNTMITRGPCKFLLAIPANGLLYSFPKDCFCYPCLRGTVAYAPAAEPDKAGGHPLVKGPATAPDDAAEPGPEDWPTYRGSPRRNCSASTEVPASLETIWSVELGGHLSAPTVSDGKAYVASVDRHMLHAVNVAAGAVAWTFAAGGRIDSPPTITRGLCIFGCRDGWVYTLRADDGRLVWKLRAAPAEQRIPAFEQLESPWPVFGSVLAVDGKVFASAGHHANAAGGIGVFGLDAGTGRVLWRSAPTEECLNSILQLTPAGNVYLAYYKIAYDARTGAAVRDSGETRPLKGGFLNDETLRVLPVRDAGRIVDVFPGKLRGKDRADNVPGEGYEVTLSRTDGGKMQPAWTRTAVPVRVNSVVLTPKAVFVAGGNDAAYDAKAANPWAAIDGQIGGSVVVLSADSGEPVGRAALDSPTVRDGLAAARGRLYAATTSGRLFCLGRK